jgi:antitoxin HicB
LKNCKESRTLEHYLRLNYPVTIYQAEEGGYVAEIEDLPGCITEGETLEEVAQKIDSARIAWLETAYEDGVDIPTPRTDEEYSGKFVVRIPKYLHRRLAERAIREGVSLNQYVGSMLASGISAHSITDEINARLDNISKQFAASRKVYAFLRSPGYAGYAEPSEAEHETRERWEVLTALEATTVDEGVAA